MGGSIRNDSPVVHRPPPPTGRFGHSRGVDAVAAVESCGGAARAGRLRPLVPQRRLTAAVAAGELVRPRPGVYALPTCPPDLLAATALSGVRSCHSAAAALGLDVVGAPGRPHVTVPRGSSTTWPGVVVHRRDVVDLDGCTDPLTTVLDCLRCLPRRAALVPVDAALRQGLVSLQDLHRSAASMNRNDARRRLLPLVDPLSDSALESVARVDLHDEGFSFRTQRVREPAGRVDFLLQDWLVVEADGYEFHGGRAPFEEDRRRDAELARQGFVVLRFTFTQIVHHREWWLSVVRDTLALGPPAGRAQAR